MSNLDTIKEELADYLTTAQAAAELGISIPRVNVLLNAHRIPGAIKLGRRWYIPPAGLEAVRERKTGRPRKTQP